MPNWTHNTIIFKNNEDLKRIAAYTKGIQDFDFNKIIERPKELNVTSGSLGVDGLILLYASSTKEKEREEINAAYKSCNVFFEDITNEQCEKKLSYYKERVSEAKREGRRYLKNYRKYGYCTWYEWSAANWGTKWNAVDVYIGATTIDFDTAWCPPFPIFEELSRLFPDIQFAVRARDEEDDVFTYLYKEGGRVTK